MVIVGLISYFRKQGVCTFDDVKKDKRRVVNVSLLVLTIAFVSYMIFNYVILEILGIAVGLLGKMMRFGINHNSIFSKLSICKIRSILTSVSDRTLL